MGKATDGTRWRVNIVRFDSTTGESSSFTPLFGSITGIESVTSMARVQEGLWIPYAILLLCVEFHASVGLYRLAIKWGADQWFSRTTLHRLEQVIFWIVLGLGSLTLLVLAGLVDPPGRHGAGAAHALALDGLAGRRRPEVPHAS